MDTITSRVFVRLLTFPLAEEIVSHDIPQRREQDPVQRYEARAYLEQDAYGKYRHPYYSIRVEVHLVQNPRGADYLYKL